MEFDIDTTIEIGHLFLFVSFLLTGFYLAQLILGVLNISNDGELICLLLPFLLVSWLVPEYIRDKVKEKLGGD